jgi:hypothetical protein
MSDDINDDNSLDDNIDSLIDQLKGSNAMSNELTKKAEDFHLDKSELEQFILDNQGALIRDSVDIVQLMKQYVASAPNAEDIGSFAELLKATSTAIDNLAKLQITKQRTDSQKEIKQMDIDAKKNINDDNNRMKLIGTREEIFNRLVKEAEVIVEEESEEQKELEEGI